MVRLALKNPFLVIVMGLAILMFGLTALTRIPTDLLPTFKTPAVQILTFYPGMPAEIVERDITTRLERWTGQSNGVARQESKSMIGVSIVKDYFRPDIDPNTAMSQVTSLAMSDLYYLPPGTVPPMVMPFDPTASNPLALITVSSPAFDEKKLYDVAYFDLRNRLQGITGVIAPAVYGGKLRRILAYVDREKLQVRGLSPIDVAKAIRANNLMIPTGNAKFGELDYQIITNSMVPEVEQINDFPIKVDDNGAPIFIKDVAKTEDSSQIQTNIVRVDGRRQVYIPVYRQPGANTIQIVDGIKEALGRILERLPKGINLDVVMDQSVYVRKAIADLIQEGTLGAALAAIMVLIFLGSFRSMAIVLISLPLAILAACVGLYFAGESLNAMTLGGLALAVGLLIDQTIVVLENISRHLGMGKSPGKAALDGTIEVATPMLIITLTIIAVFFPVVFITGIGKFLFTPLALSVSFALIASYVLALMVVPTCAARFLKSRVSGESRAPSSESVSHGFERWFDPIKDRYGRFLEWVLSRRKRVLAAVAVVFFGSLLLYPLIGKELLPAVDAGQLMIHVRAPSGTRVEVTEGVIEKVESEIRQAVPAEELKTMISNIGVLYDWPAAYTPNSGPMDAFVNLQFSDARTKTAQEYASLLRARLRERFAGIEFAFDTGGLITAALNFGLPAPINIQVEGNKLETAYEVASRIKEMVAEVPGTVDVRIQQKLDYPQIAVDVDRVKAAQLGLTQEQVVKNVVTTLNSSINFDPAFWIDENNGNHYFIGAQYRESDIKSIETLKDVPITSPAQSQPIPLRNIASFKRATAPGEVNHLNITRVIDVYANVEGRDIGSVAADIEEKLKDVKTPEGYFVRVRGEVQSMRESFGSLGFGLVMAVGLVYLVMVIQFRSFMDPFIVMFAVPLGAVGVLWMLFLTNTTFNVQSLMGVIMMVGVVVAFSLLMVDFANRLRSEGVETKRAIVEAARLRLRPIIMTSLAATLGLVPMAIAGGANIPLARAMVGGVLASTVLTLVVVPILYTILKRNQKASNVLEEADFQEGYLFRPRSPGRQAPNSSS
ncbi:MAG TPA: efflux RND transporter permease subunit [Blastocatellia bacterium]|nr:efflux RND transporter permease subunit [Blastocatellia bacterium]